MASAAPNLHANFGLPVCLSGIPLPLPQEMADHDRRRKAMKTPAAAAAFEPKDTWGSSSGAERGNQTSPGPGDSDFASVLRDLGSISLGRTAKAA
ncbi:PREDICTED: uncharacterized protein LOC109158837 [Ipomoea nil]|uniref:uncharacterized protein LOC109158837 n=1 Tax=Ipomoea nil TaxID=35883 RepID=UPI000900B0AA|nr:PREDICTED: uncharacterized protein LOC109158837 [Ipomoea nil]